MGITPKINSNTLLALWSGFAVHRTADCGLWMGSRWTRPPFAGFLGWVYSARDCGLYGVGSQIASFGGRFTGPQIAGFMGWVHILWASWVGFTGPQIVGFVWFHRATDCGLCGVDSQIAGFVGWEVHRAENGRQVLQQGILRLILTHLPQTSLTHILITPALVQCWVNVPMVGIWPTPMVGIFYIVTQLHVTPCVLQDVGQICLHVEYWQTYILSLILPTYRVFTMLVQCGYCWWNGNQRHRIIIFYFISLYRTKQFPSDVSSGNNIGKWSETTNWMYTMH